MGKEARDMSWWQQATLEDANYENGPQYSCKGRAMNIFSRVRFGLERELS